MKVICSLTVLLAVSLTEGLSLGHAEDKASPLAAAALNECERGRLARDRAARLTHFEAGQRLGERAVQADDRLADAHFLCSAIWANKCGSTVRRAWRRSLGFGACYEN